MTEDRRGPDRPSRRAGRVRQAALSSPAVRAAAGRISWGLADQAVSSLTNFAVGAVVARALGATAFGAFSLVWVTYAVLLNVSRGLATDPLMVRFSATERTVRRSAVRQATGTALCLGAVTGAVCVLAGVLIGGILGGGFIALGLGLPVLLLQDSWRLAFFTSGEGHRSFANDMIWAIGLVPSLAVAHQHGSVAAFVVAWWLPAGFAALIGVGQARVVPLVSGVREWLRRHRDLGARYMIENLSNSFAAQLRAYGVGAIAGLATVGALRGAVLLLGPFLMLLFGLAQVGVPEAARALNRSPGRLRHFCLTFGALQATAALCWGLLLLFALPDTVGRAVLGDVWGAASELILPVTIEVMAAAVATSASTGIRALGAAPRGLRAQLVASAVYLILGLGGAALAGAPGSAWGVAIAAVLTNAMWWTQLKRALDQWTPTSHPRPTVNALGVHQTEPEL